MGFKIYLFLFGTITLTCGKPANDQVNGNELQQLLKSLSNKGKYNVAFSHHEDGPKSHHEDRARISHQDDDPYQNQRTQQAAKQRAGLHQLADNDEPPSFTNIQTLNLLLNKKQSDSRSDDNESGDDANVENLLQRGNDNVADVLDFLRDLNNKLDAGSKQARSGRNRDDDDDRDDCRGDRCGGLRNDDDRDDDDRDDNDRDDDDRDGNDDRDDDDDNDRDRNDNRNDNNRNDDNDLRCNGATCARGRNDLTSLRERHQSNANQQLQLILQPRENKYRVNNDVDAIVFDLSDLDKSPAKSQYRNYDNNQQNDVQYIDNIDFGNLLANLASEAHNRQNSLDSESKPIEAIIVDLSQPQNDLAKSLQSLVRNINNPLRKGRKNKNKKQRSRGHSKKTSRTASKILAHNEHNNNVYVPKWLLNDAKFKRSPAQALKKVLPMTAKQKQNLIKALKIKNGNPQKVKEAKPKHGRNASRRFDIGPLPP